MFALKLWLLWRMVTRSHWMCMISAKDLLASYQWHSWGKPLKASGKWNIHMIMLYHKVDWSLILWDTCSGSTLEAADSICIERHLFIVDILESLLLFTCIIISRWWNFLLSVLSEGSFPALKIIWVGFVFTWMLHYYGSFILCIKWLKLQASCFCYFFFFFCLMCHKHHHHYHHQSLILTISQLVTWISFLHSNLC